MELINSQPLARKLNVASWLLQILIAVILLQTLFFKFTGAEESVYIFTTLGAEPWGRLGSGIIELIASALLLIPRAVTWGALLSLGTACGAILSHLAFLGLVVKDDGGLLFGLATMVLLCSAVILWMRRREIPIVGNWF